MRTVRLLTLVVALLVAAPGPGAGAAAPALPVGTSTQSVTVGGVPRSYLVHRPAGLRRPAPLVVVLHGGYGTGAQAEIDYGWDALSDRDRFVVAYPNGVGRAWNVGDGCCGLPARAGLDDVAFVRALVRAIGHQVPIDPRRRYATGISNGGAMAYRLACDTRLFAAIGPDSATLLGPCTDPAPLSVLAVHGTADRFVPYRGGVGQGVSHIDGPSIPAVNAHWRAVDGCGAPRVRRAGVVTTSTAACPSGRAVGLITIAGAGHQWPGAVPRPLAEAVLGLDPPSKALDATAVFWRFFAAHPAPAPLPA